MEDKDWVIRLNGLGKAVGGADNLISFDPDELIETAIRTTGLDDFGGDRWRENYFTYFQLVDYGRSFTTLGRLMQKSALIRFLRNRLLVTDKIKGEGEILNEHIERPVFVVGNPRSGTSILFELLSQDRYFRSPLAWEVTCPVRLQDPAVDVATSRWIAETWNEFLADIQPDIDNMHEVRWYLPVECLEIMRMNFVPLERPMGSYKEWVRGIDESCSYEWHKKIIQLLQYQGMVGEEGKKTWLLKCPVHLHFLEKIFSLYPDARIIYIHRDPGKSMPSLVDLMAHMARCLSDSFSVDDMVQQIVPWREIFKKVIEDRATGVIPNDQIADIQFHDLMRDPVGSIKTVYDQLGLPFTDEFAEAIRQYLENKPSARFRKHKYAASEFKLEVSEIRQQFKEYMDHYNVAVER